MSKYRNDRYKFTLLFLQLNIIMSPLRSYGIIVAGVNFSLFRITGLLFIVSFMVAILRERDASFYLPNALKIAIMIWILSLASIVYSPSISGSSSNYISVVYGFLWIICFCLFAQRRKDIVFHALKMIVISSIFPIILGEYQAIMYQLTGVIPNLPFDALVVSEGKLGLTYNVYVRITSCFGDPGYFSTFLVFATGSALFFLLENKVKISGKFKLLCIIEVMFSLFITVQMLSFSGIISLAFLFIGEVLFSKNRGKALINVFLPLIAMIIGIFTFQQIFGYDIMQGVRFKWETQPSNEAFFGRGDYILNALDRFFENPLFGAGFGGLSLGTGYFSSAHSSFLTILGQQGIIVFVFYIILLILMPIRYFFCVNEGYWFSAKRVYLPLAAVIVLSIGYDTMFSFDTTYVFIGIVTVLTCNCGGFDGCGEYDEGKKGLDDNVLYRSFDNSL